MTTQFQIGQYYSARSHVQHDSISVYKVINRTKCFVHLQTFSFNNNDVVGEVFKKKVRVYDGVECCSASSIAFLQANEQMEMKDAGDELEYDRIKKEGEIAYKVDGKFACMFGEETKGYQAYLEGWNKAKRNANKEQQLEAVEDYHQEVDNLEVEEIEPYFVKAKFPTLNKQNTLEEYQEKLQDDFQETEVKICYEIELTPHQWDIFTLSFLADYQWLAGKGGSSSHYEPNQRLETFKDFAKLGEADRNLWIENSYRDNCVLVKCGNDYLVVDPQGRNYACYVGLEVEFSEDSKESKTEPELTQEELINGLADYLSRKNWNGTIEQANNILKFDDHKQLLQSNLELISELIFGF